MAEEVSHLIERTETHPVKFCAASVLAFGGIKVQSVGHHSSFNKMVGRRSPLKGLTVCSMERHLIVNVVVDTCARRDEIGVIRKCCKTLIPEYRFPRPMANSHLYLRPQYIYDKDDE